MDEEEETVPVLDMKAATKCLNKIISNSSPLINKGRKVACTVLWTLPGIKWFPTIGKHAKSLVVGKVHLLSSQLLHLAGYVFSTSWISLLMDTNEKRREHPRKFLDIDTGVQERCAQCMQLLQSLSQVGLCSVHAIITKLVTIGGKMLARPLLLGSCPSFIPSRVFSPSSPLSLLITDARHPTALTI